ncbi:MAG TPA: MFS transporter [Herbaspirillum sp.]|jgi:putative MFS transporter
MKNSIDIERASALLGRLGALPIGRPTYLMFVAIGIATMAEGLDIGAMSVILPRLKSLMQLAPYQIGMLAAASTFGITLSSLPVGLLADRVGRKRMLMTGFLICSVFTLLSGLAPNFSVLVVFRFLSGIGMAAVFVTPYALVSEFVPGHKRGKVITIAECFLGLGYLLAPGLGLLCFHYLAPEAAWRLDLVLSGAPVIFFLFVSRNVPESPRWLVSSGRLDEAEVIITKFERLNARTSIKLVAPTIFNAESELRTERLSLRETFRVLFAAKLALRWISLGCGTFGVFAVFFVSLGYLPSLFIDRGITFSNSLLYTLIATAFQIPGKITLSFLSDKIGRKPTFAVSMVCAISCLSLFILFKDPISTICFSTLFLFFIAGCAPSYKLWYAEIFPTSVRTTGQTLVEGFFGRFLGGVVWISVFPLIAHEFGQTETLILLTVMLFVVSLPPLFFTPETRRTRLLKNPESDIGTGFEAGAFHKH